MRTVGLTFPKVEKPKQKPKNQTEAEKSNRKGETKKIKKRRSYDIH